MDDRQETKRSGLILLLVVLFFVAILIVSIAVLSAGDADAPTALPSSEPSPSQTSESPTPIPVPPVLASGEDEDFVFDVMDIETGVPTINGGGLYTAEAVGTYTLVKVRVSNIGDEPLGFFLDDIAGVDSWGRVLEGDGQAEMFVNDDLGEMVIPAGSVTKVVVFDVTDGTELTAIIGTGSSPGSVATEDGVEIPLP